MPEVPPGDVAEIVKSAFERDSSERPRFLDEVCGGDADLRAEVESLLNFGERAPRFIDQPAVHLAADLFVENETLRRGARLGQYEICSIIGSGGMGDVYLAEDTKLGRKVALKLVKYGLGTPNIIRHFRREERILAGLNHPCIARLYGGGVTPEGVPYFIMEYIEGERLDEYCRIRGLTITDRIELFRKICSAVTYAHQNLVIHRDLKPANIRVTAEGEPKLLDFGIAKLIDSENAQSSALTLTLQAVMTPEYASPEQVTGGSITTASDVYSLGVVLYNLLTGQSPYRTKTNRADELARAIAEQEPTRPSTALAKSEAENQKPKNQKPKSLRGDLDNIILMAMRKEPARRYESAAQFSADLQRHLNGLPVIARKDTFQYRGTKFIKRNKVGVLAATLVLVTLLAGIAMTTWQKRRAERRFNDVRELANSFVFEVYNAIEQLPGSTPSRVLLVNRALKYLASLAEEAGGDHSLQLDLARAYLRVGDMQGSPYRPNIGDTAGALVSYRRGLIILKALSQADSKNLDVQYYHALANESIGRVQMRQASWADALASERRALAICEQLVGAQPTSAKYRKLMGDTYMQLGMAMQQNDAILSVENFQQACTLFRQAISIHEALVAADPGDGEYRHALGADYGSLGYTQQKISDLTGDPENYHRAVESDLKELEINEALWRSDPTNPSYRDLFGVAHMDLANSQMKLGEAAQALPHFREYLLTFESLAASDPTNAEFRTSVSDAYFFVGKALARTGDISGAMENSLKALAGYLAASAADPTNAEKRAGLITVHEQIGGIHEKAGNEEGALESYGKALAVLEAWLSATPASAEVLRSVASEHSNIGKVYENLASDPKSTVDERREAWRKARASYQRSSEIWQKMRDHGQLNARDAKRLDVVKNDLANCSKALAE